MGKNTCKPIHSDAFNLKCVTAAANAQNVVSSEMTEEQKSSVTNNVLLISL